jgi:PEP-CTERM motif
MKIWCNALLLAIAACFVPLAMAGTVTADFDTCVPQNIVNLGTPLAQTCSGVTFHFSSPHDGWSGGGYSVQNAGKTSWTLSQFSGNYLVPSGLNPGALDIHFSQPVYSISFSFATGDFNQNEVPTTIQTDAYFNSTLSGSTQAHGIYGSDTMPMGSLTLDMGATAFNWARIWIPWQPLGSTDVLVDNIVVKTGNFAATPEPASLGLIGGGLLTLFSAARRRLMR